MILTQRKFIFDNFPIKFGVKFTSDQHIGHNYTDYEMIRNELKEARRNNWRININGDLFDAILPSDKKRFRLHVPHPRIREAGENGLSEAINWAEEIYSPYVDLIDMIGTGTHDDAVAKHHNIDPILTLVKQLNKQGGNIAYGDWCGFIDYSFILNNKNIDHLRIHYHHGSGGSAPVTKGIIDFNRTQTWIEGVDIIWKAHKHNKLYHPDRIVKLESGSYKHYPRLNIFTAPYMTNYQDVDPKILLKRGRTPDFVKDNLFAPCSLGGVTVKININKKRVKKLIFEDILL